MTTHLLLKRRTREHIIASLGALHVETLIVEAGHTAERVANDYGYDLILITHDGEGYPEPGCVFIQVKASDKLPASPAAAEHVLTLDRRDYNRWIREPYPVFVVLYDAQQRKGFCVYLQAYFTAHPERRPPASAKTVSVRVRTTDVTALEAIAYMQRAKADVLPQLEEETTHYG